MPYEQQSSKKIPFPLEKVFSSTLSTLQFMGGKIIKNDVERGILTAQMDKKLFGNYLGDRSQVEINFIREADEGTTINIFAYPLNAIGQKLLFGARKGVVETIIRVFYQELEKRLEKDSST
jgi:hypothetical protein